MKTKNNIVIIHTGYSKYLYYCLIQARKTNPNAFIYLIGDKEYKKLSRYSEFVNINDLVSDDINLFENSYIHLGKSSYKFEMFCIKRWFILRNFMDKFNISSCLHIDSDVMLLADTEESLEYFNDCDIALANNLALTMKINNINVIKEFCNFIIDIYTKEENINYLKSLYFDTDRCSIGTAGSISDMDLSRMFFESTSFSVKNLSEIYNNSFFDSAIIYGDPNFEMIKKGRYTMKKVFFENEVAYCHVCENPNLKIRVNSLHFLVWSKIYMKKILKCEDLNFNPIYINTYREFVVFYKKIKNILS